MWQQQRQQHVHSGKLQVKGMKAATCAIACCMKQVPLQSAYVLVALQRTHAWRKTTQEFMWLRLPSILLLVNLSLPAVLLQASGFSQRFLHSIAHVQLRADADFKVLLV
jgi:hypothetical protein